jgi:hypothetical protein
MKYILLFSLVVALFFRAELLLAQDKPAFFLSKARQREKTSRTYSLLHSNDDVFYTLRTDARFTEGELQTYDKKLNFLKSGALTAKMNDKYTGALNVQGHLYLLQLRYRHDAETDIYRDVSFVAYPIDTQKMELAKEPLVLVAPFTMESNYYRGNFAISPDRSKILLYDYEEDGEIEDVKGLTNIINIRVFDNNFKLLWQRKVNISPNNQSKKVVAVKKFRINNQGSVAVLTDIFKENVSRSYLSKTTTIDPTLFFIGREEADFLRFTPNLGDVFYNEVDFSFDHRGHIHWVGCYSKQRYYQQSGFFYLQLNANCSRVLVKKSHDFSPELIAQMRRKRAPKLGRELRNYKLSSWRIQPQTFELTVVLENQPPASFSFKSHQMLVLRLDTLGELRWAVPVFKWGDVKESYESFLSHYMAVQGDYTYLIYNNGIYAENQAIIARIDKDGNKQEKVFLRYNRQQEILCPRLTSVVGERLFICLQSQFFDSYSFGLVDLRRFFE